MKKSNNVTVTIVAEIEDINELFADIDAEENWVYEEKYDRELVETVADECGSMFQIKNVNIEGRTYSVSRRSQFAISRQKVTK